MLLISRAQVCGIAEGLRYLHSFKAVHGDLSTVRLTV
jgi:hypothetical protein